MNHSSNVELLAKVIQELAAAKNLEAVMMVVRKAARKFSGAQGATYIIREGELCYYADEDALTPLWKGKRFPAESCISGWAMTNRTTVVVEDVFSDPRIPIDLYQKTFVKSLAIFPIRLVDPIGAIGCYWSKRYVPSQEELTLLQSLADITSVRIENIRFDNELEQRVVERTLELEKANNEIQSFAYSISHDLRAPLRGIHGFMSIILEDHGEKLSPDVKALAGKVMRNSRHMSMLIEGLLTFFKMGRQELSKTNVQMKKVVSEICNSILEEERFRNVDLVLKDLPNSLADHTLIKQVWVNLISNAFKYSAKKQSARIEIGSLVNSGTITYYVSDNGAGFDMAFRDKLFLVFQRLHSQREFEGSGIGLAIAEKIVSKHGGKIWAEGKTGAGATFYFTLA